MADTPTKPSNITLHPKAAEATGVPFLILDCEAPEAVIAQWLAQRQAEGLDPSDALKLTRRQIEHQVVRAD